MIRVRRSRRARLYRSIAASGIFGVVLGAASLASACVPQPNLVVVQPRSSGPSGTEVTVEGVGLDPSPTEIRWNSAEGPLLGEAVGPSFSVPVTIPEASPGLYTVVVVSRQSGGGIGNTGTAAFQVIEPGTGPGLVPPPPEDAGAAPTTPPPTATPSASAGRTVLAFAAGAALATLGVWVARRRRQ